MQTGSTYEGPAGGAVSEGEKADAPLAGRTALRSMSPIVPVRRIARSIPFYTEILGFELRERDEAGTFAYLARDGVGLMLIDLDDHKSVRATTEFLSAYVWVEDAAALFRALEPALASLPEKRYSDLVVKPDGRREFRVTDPDGFLMFFGDMGDRAPVS